MASTVRCSGCGVTLKLGDHAKTSGTIKCPKCGKPIALDGAQASAVKEGAGAETKKAAGHKPKKKSSSRKQSQSNALLWFGLGGGVLVVAIAIGAVFMLRTTGVVAFDYSTVDIEHFLGEPRKFDVVRYSRPLEMAQSPAFKDLVLTRQILPPGFLSPRMLTELVSIEESIRVSAVGGDSVEITRFTPEAAKAFPRLPGNITFYRGRAIHQIPPRPNSISNEDHHACWASDQTLIVCSHRETLQKSLDGAAKGGGGATLNLPRSAQFAMRCESADLPWSLLHLDLRLGDPKSPFSAVKRLLPSRDNMFAHRWRHDFTDCVYSITMTDKIKLEFVGEFDASKSPDVLQEFKSPEELVKAISKGNDAIAALFGASKPAGILGGLFSAKSAASSLPPGLEVTSSVVEGKKLAVTVTVSEPLFDAIREFMVGGFKEPVLFPDPPPLDMGKLREEAQKKAIDEAKKRVEDAKKKADDDRKKAAEEAAQKKKK